MINPREATPRRPVIDPPGRGHSGDGGGRFRDRHDAGRRLAAALRPLALDSPLLLALPRGGVPVAAEIARALPADFDVLLVRKLSAPMHAELGIGAIVGGANSQPVLNRGLIDRLQVPDDYIEREVQRQREEINRRRRCYCGDRPPPVLAGRNVVVVDDGVATGSTMEAALRACRAEKAARVLFAVPVAPPDVAARLLSEADDGISLLMPEHFRSVGDFYDDFTQTTDEEVVALLGAAS
ncbi:phosphoribosyltransferase [Noviherbaspirillum galbum]|uniref:Phosphoribosyltransferase n=1 Tax=Noviherbaspirillum galbum TaxID=2709383 RepID=A0A6B3ST99_9BURK|nr:phosphoribosyltransferase family protein [Noviherbaspirillum galbum]NEX64200.1 phosphoribosyltransferase [Noviherbaspirillum galbum]